MRSGKLRGVSLALGLACVLTFVLGNTASTQAQGLHTIPRLVEGVDVNTGGPYYAPPVPYGHYAGKNIPGRLGSKARGLFSGLHNGGGVGHGMGSGCGACGGAGCGACGGGNGGLFSHGHGAGLCDGNDGCGLGHGGFGHGGSLSTGCSTCGTVAASAQEPFIAPMSSAQNPCGDPGCGLFRRGSHHHKRGCGACGDRGCGTCAVADSCGSCGGRGCGLCGGLGNGLGHGLGLCKRCGGQGCSACSKAKGLVHHMLGRDKIKWFVGAGGPVPITPGYTPYINVTRSPRDFFAFPPFTQ